MRRPLSSPPFLLLLALTSLAFGGYAILLPVVPLWVARGGSGEFGAGLTTGVLMIVTVGTQLLVPALLRWAGHRPVLVVGALLLGLPTPLLALTADLLPVLLISTVRGVGFGLVTVAGSALVAELVDPSGHGRASARYGYASGLPQLALLPAGIAVVDLAGFTTAFVIAGIGPLVAAAVALFLRAPHPARSDTGRVRPRQAGRRLPLAPVVAMLGCSTAQGGVITFAPLAAPGATVAVPAALFVTALGTLFGRGVAGTLVDRSGRLGSMLPIGTLLAAVGLLGVLAAPLTPVLLVVGAVVVGFGFGLVQNDAMVTLFARAGPRNYGGASAAWNIAYDAGTGVGASGLGAIAEPFGFAAAFGTAAAALVVMTPFVRRTG